MKKTVIRSLDFLKKIVHCMPFVVNILRKNEVFHHHYIIFL